MEKSLSNLYFTIAVAAFLAAILIIVLRNVRRLRRVSGGDWEALLGRLQQVDRNAIATIAHDALDEPADGALAEQPAELEGWQISSMLGGLEGLELLERNCEVLIDLAAYVQRWYPEAIVVAEHLRLNARELEWHVGRLKGAAETGNLQTAFAEYAQRAVVIYYLMTRNVLELYERTSLPESARLQAAL